MGFDLRAQAECESSFRVRIQIVADIGQDHGAAGKRDRNACDQIYFFGVFSSQHQREEGIMVHFRCANAVVTKRFQLPSGGGDLVEVVTYACVDFHLNPLSL